MGWGKLKAITIEPVMFLQMAGDTLTFVIFQNLFIEKICRNTLHYDSQTCENYTKSSVDDIDIYDPYLMKVKENIQGESSTFLLVNSLVENSLPIFLVLFLGVWSDANRKRKPPLLLSLFGKLMRSFGLLVNAYFMKWSPLVLLFTVALPHSLGGANAVFHMSAFSYLADSSVPRNRTWKLGIAEAFWQIGTPVGVFLGAYLFDKGGYTCVFATSFLFHLIGILYTACVLPEVPSPKPSQYYGNMNRFGYGTMGYRRMRLYSEQINDTSTFNLNYNSNPTVFPSLLKPPMPMPNRLQLQNESQTDSSKLIPFSSNNNNNNTNYQEQEQNCPVSIFVDQSLILEDNNNTSVTEFIVGSIKAILKKRPNHTRKCLLALGLIMLMYGIGYHGEMNLKYLFTRNKFGWREQEFSLWTIFESIIIVLGLTLAMPILSKILKISDTLSGSLAAFSRACSRTFIALAPKSKYLYYGSMIDICGVIGPLTVRSLASKCVLRDERGKIFAFLGCIEAIVPLIAVPLYSVVYSSTFAKTPSAIYYLSIGIYLVNFLIFSILYIAEKLKLIYFSGNDLSSLLNNSNSPADIPDCYRRTSLS